MDRRLLLASGAYIDLSEYLLKSEAETLYAPLDAILNKQDKLISGTNIKTINGNSLLGGGDITISGGGDYLPLTGGTITGDLTIASGIGGAGNLHVAQECSAGYFNCGKYFFNNTNGLVGSTKGFTLEDQYGDYVIEFTYKGNGTKFLSDDGTYKTISSGSSGGSGAYSEVNHGTNDTTFTLTPNTFHVWDEVSSLTLTLGAETSGVANEYLFQFTSGSEATTLSLPDDIKWANELSIEPNMIYQISILKGLGSVLEFSNAPVLIENKCTGELNGSDVVFTFQYPVASTLEITFRGEMTTTITINKGETSVTHGGGRLPEYNGIVTIFPSQDDMYKYIY